LDYVNQWNGTNLKVDDVVECLKRMGHGASVGAGSADVVVPAYRSDIIHPVDLAEDVAIGFGFEKFGKALPRQLTFGEEVPMLMFANSVRMIMTGLGYFEIVTLSLSNPREQYQAMNIREEKGVIKVKNPVSEEHVLVRTSLLPSVLAILRKNRHRELPQKVFEIGDVVMHKKNRKLFSGASIHARASFTEVKSLVQSSISAMGLTSDITQGSHPSFIPGRCAIVLVSNEPVGVFGEISPSTIEAFELNYPIVAFELDLEKLFQMHGERHSG